MKRSDLPLRVPSGTRFISPSAPRKPGNEVRGVLHRETAESAFAGFNELTQLQKSPNQIFVHFTLEIEMRILAVVVLLSACGGGDPNDPTMSSLSTAAPSSLSTATQDPAPTPDSIRYPIARQEPARGLNDQPPTASIVLAAMPGSIPYHVAAQDPARGLNDEPPTASIVPSAMPGSISYSVAVDDPARGLNDQLPTTSIESSRETSDNH